MFNDARGVQLEVEGDPAAVECFLGRLVGEAPPLAVVERVSCSEIEPVGEAGFEILGSDAGGEQLAPVAADAATCADCLAELFDPADRRYRYPFINCTNCGPRFTIVRGTPYDRPRTTMAGFEMCRRCRAEYEDPADRRFHAQPNACPDCGPRARLLSDAGQPAARSRRRRGGRVRGAAGRRDRGREGTGRLPPRLPRRPRGSGRRAARPQAPRGEAVCADGTRPRSGAAAGRARSRAGGAAGGSRTPHRARPPPRPGGGGARGRAGLARPRLDAALLAASSPAAGRRRHDAGDDERQRLR